MGEAAEGESDTDQILGLWRGRERRRIMQSICASTVENSTFRMVKASRMSGFARPAMDAGWGHAGTDKGGFSMNPVGNGDNRC